MAVADDTPFAQIACQYYVQARFAMHAQCMPACGNLFHHAVEIFLKAGIVKAGLAQNHKLSVLKGMGHDLKNLWRAFKADFPESALERHDKTILLLNKFEAIRYPNDEHMAATAQWFGPAATRPRMVGSKLRNNTRSSSATSTI